MQDDEFITDMPMEPLARSISVYDDNCIANLVLKQANLMNNSPEEFMFNFGWKTVPLFCENLSLAFSLDTEDQENAMTQEEMSDLIIKRTRSIKSSCDTNELDVSNLHLGINSFQVICDLLNQYPIFTRVNFSENIIDDESLQLILDWIKNFTARRKQFKELNKHIRCVKNIDEDIDVSNVSSEDDDDEKKQDNNIDYTLDLEIRSCGLQPEQFHSIFLYMNQANCMSRIDISNGISQSLDQSSLREIKKGQSRRGSIQQVKLLETQKRNIIGKEGANALIECLNANSRLKELIIRDIDSDGFNTFCRSIPLVNPLSLLDWSFNKPDDSNFSHCIRSLANTQLKELKSIGIPLSPAPASAIINLLQNSNTLSILNLSRCFIVASGEDMTKTMRQTCFLEELFSAVSEPENIHTLILDNNPFEDTATQMLVKLLKRTDSMELRVLSLANTMLRHSHELFRALKENTTLETLDLSHNDISYNESINILSEIVPSLVVDKANEQNIIFHKSTVPEVSPFPGLRELILSKTDISDKTCPIWMYLLSCSPNLKKIDLSHNMLTSVSHKMFMAGLKKTDRFIYCKELILDGNDLTEKEVDLINDKLIGLWRSKELSILQSELSIEYDNAQNGLDEKQSMEDINTHINILEKLQEELESMTLNWPVEESQMKVELEQLESNSYSEVLGMNSQTMSMNEQYESLTSFQNTLKKGYEKEEHIIENLIEKEKKNIVTYLNEFDLFYTVQYRKLMDIFSLEWRQLCKLKRDMNQIQCTVLTYLTIFQGKNVYEDDPAYSKKLKKWNLLRSFIFHGKGTMSKPRVPCPIMQFSLMFVCEHGQTGNYTMLAPTNEYLYDYYAEKGLSKHAILLLRLTTASDLTKFILPIDESDIIQEEKNETKNMSATYARLAAEREHENMIPIQSLSYPFVFPGNMRIVDMYNIVASTLNLHLDQIGGIYYEQLSLEICNKRTQPLFLQHEIIHQIVLPNHKFIPNVELFIEDKLNIDDVYNRNEKKVVELIKLNSEEKQKDYEIYFKERKMEREKNHENDDDAIVLNEESKAKKEIYPFAEAISMFIDRLARHLLPSLDMDIIREQFYCFPLKEKQIVQNINEFEEMLKDIVFKREDYDLICLEWEEYKHHFEKVMEEERKIVEKKPFIGEKHITGHFESVLTNEMSRPIFTSSFLDYMKKNDMIIDANDHSSILESLELFVKKYHLDKTERLQLFQSFYISNDDTNDRLNWVTVNDLEINGINYYVNDHLISNLLKFLFKEQSENNKNHSPIRLSRSGSIVSDIDENSDDEEKKKDNKDDDDEGDFEHIVTFSHNYDIHKDMLIEDQSMDVEKQELFRNFLKKFTSILGMNDYESDTFLALFSRDISSSSSTPTSSRTPSRTPTNKRKNESKKNNSSRKSSIVSRRNSLSQLTPVDVNSDEFFVVDLNPDIINERVENYVHSELLLCLYELELCAGCTQLIIDPLYDITIFDTILKLRRASKTETIIDIIRILPTPEENEKFLRRFGNDDMHYRISEMIEFLDLFKAPSGLIRCIDNYSIEEVLKSYNIELYNKLLEFYEKERSSKVKFTVSIPYKAIKEQKQDELLIDQSRRRQSLVSNETGSICALAQSIKAKLQFMHEKYPDSIPIDMIETINKHIIDTSDREYIDICLVTPFFSPKLLSEWYLLDWQAPKRNKEEANLRFHDVVEMKDEEGLLSTGFLNTTLENNRDDHRNYLVQLEQTEQSKLIKTRENADKEYINNLMNEFDISVLRDTVQKRKLKKLTSEEKWSNSASYRFLKYQNNETKDDRRLHASIWPAPGKGGTSNIGLNIYPRPVGIPGYQFYNDEKSLSRLIKKRDHKSYIERHSIKPIQRSASAGILRNKKIEENTPEIEDYAFHALFGRTSRSAYGSTRKTKSRKMNEKGEKKKLNNQSNKGKDKDIFLESHQFGKDMVYVDDLLNNERISNLPLNDNDFEFQYIQHERPRQSTPSASIQVMIAEQIPFSPSKSSSQIDSLGYDSISNNHNNNNNNIGDDSVILNSCIPRGHIKGPSLNLHKSKVWDTRSMRESTNDHDEFISQQVHVSKTQSSKSSLEEFIKGKKRKEKRRRKKDKDSSLSPIKYQTENYSSKKSKSKQYEFEKLMKKAQSAYQSGIRTGIKYSSKNEPYSINNNNNNFNEIHKEYNTLVKEEEYMLRNQRHYGYLSRNISAPQLSILSNNRKTLYPSVSSNLLDNI